MRERVFTPRLCIKSYGKLNAWLKDKCIAWAQAHPHPEQPDRAIWEVFEGERPSSFPIGSLRRIPCLAGVEDLPGAVRQ